MGAGNRYSHQLPLCHSLERPVILFSFFTPRQQRFDRSPGNFHCAPLRLCVKLICRADYARHRSLIQKKPIFPMKMCSQYGKLICIYKRDTTILAPCKNVFTNSKIPIIMAKAKKAAKKATKKAAKKAPAKKAAKKAAPKKKSARKPNAAFMAPLQPSNTLAEVIGNKPMARTEIVKKIWDYIKKNNLQDKKNRRMINADSKLRPLFGKDQISMFELAKVVNKHVKK
jgi:upstream activation factor subunit UAF30